MAEFFTSFPSQQIKPVEFKAQDLINIGRTGIAYQREEQGNKERLGLQEFFSNPENFQTEGRIDLDKINAAVPKIAPLTGRDVIRNMSDLSTAQTQAISAKQNLTQDQRKLVGQTFNILGKAGVNDRGTYMAALDDLVKTNPENKDLARLVDSYKTIWGKMPENTPWSQFAQVGGQSLLSPSEQEQLFGPKPGTISTGAATFPTITQPSVAGLPPRQEVGQVPLATAQLPPGSTMEATGRVDMNNQPTAYVRDQATGRILGEVVIPGGAAQMPGANVPTTGVPPGARPGAPMAPQAVPQAGPQPIPQAGPQPAPAMPTNAPARMPAGETATTLDAAQALRTNTRQMAAQVPMQQFNNNQIIKLADDTITGKGANFVGALSGGYAAIPWSSDNASNLNQLGHYMSLQTASLAQSSGLAGTDAARNIAGQMSGTTEWTPQAIKTTARVNRALSTATDLFNRGIDNEFNRTKNPFSTTEFQQRWTRTLGNDGINAIRLYDAMQNKDKEGIREVVTQVGGPNSPGYKTLVQKIEAMQRLVGGQ